MNFLPPDDAITDIIEKVKTLRGDPLPNEAVVKLYAEKMIADVLDYCHREDFPAALTYSVAELIGKQLDDIQNGGREPLQSIKMDDTEFRFATAAAPAVGSLAEADFATLRPKLNLYRKVRWSL
ncbi:MAG: hypothetical protein LKI17_06345 [Megasphaera cerevisiae]|jgi:hypothetical protein|nr:hypothetical protein [Megasphaera cerevisiae]